MGNFSFYEAFGEQRQSPSVASPVAGAQAHGPSLLSHMYPQKLC